MSFELLSPTKAPMAPAWHVERWFNASADLTLEEHRGRVVALHAFQMLCPGCVAHGIPQAQRIRSVFSPDQVAVIGLHTVFEHHAAMSPTSLSAFLHEYRVSFPVGVDMARPDDSVPATMAAYGMRGTPTLILIDRQGRVRLHAFGRPDDMQVGAAIAALIEEPAVRAHDEGTELDGCTSDACAI